MSDNTPGWQRSFAAEQRATKCPRPIFAGLVMEVCKRARRLLDAVGRRSWRGEIEETLEAMRQLENTRPPDLTDQDRALLDELSQAIGSTDPDRKAKDPADYVPRRDYGILYNWQPAPDPGITPAPDAVDFVALALQAIEANEVHWRADAARAKDAEAQAAQGKRGRPKTAPATTEPASA